MQANLELKKVLEKVWDGQSLTYADTAFVKRTYHDLRRTFDTVVADTEDDEMKVQALRHALASLEARTLVGPEFLHEVMYSYRAMKDKRQKDRMLRSEIAYRMALSAFAYEHLKAQRKLELTVATSEFLHQMDALDVSLQKYHRLMRSRQRTSQTAALALQ